MYPCLQLPCVDDCLNFNDIKPLSPQDIMDRMGNYYAKSFIAQFRFLTEFSTALMKDISHDVNMMRNRISLLTTRVQKAKSEVAGSLKQLESHNTESFFIPPSGEIQIPDITSNNGSSPGLFIENVQKTFNEPTAELNFEKFRGIGRVTDPTDINKMISDPSLMLNMYVKELTEQLHEMEGNMRPRRTVLAKKRAIVPLITQQESDAMISAYTGVVRHQDRVLVTPPPVGTSDWRAHATKFPARGSGASIEEAPLPPHERKPRQPKKPRPPPKKRVRRPDPVPTKSVAAPPPPSGNAPPPPPPPPAANLPPPPPPPPPPPTNLPPPPPPTSGGNIAMPTLKKVDKPAAPATAAPQADFLTLIKAGNFGLKKVNQEDVKKPEAAPAGEDIAQLLLLEMQRRREDIRDSDSDNDDDEYYSSDSESDW